MQIVIATVLAVVCLAPTSAALAQSGGAINCQRDISCFAQASPSCGRAIVEVQLAIPLRGTELDSTQSYEILGTEGEQCLFRSRVERIATRHPGAGVAREQLEQQRAVIAAILASIERLNVTCRFAPDELTAMLDRWVTTPIVANAELDRPECRSGPAIGDVRPAAGLYPPPHERRPVPGEPCLCDSSLVSGRNPMTDMKSYDGDLQMFPELPGAVNVHHLQFLRWLIEQGRLEHSPAGPPSGPLAETPAEEALVEAT